MDATALLLSRIQFGFTILIPFAITIDDAAAPHSTLAFMFWGEGLFVFPLMLLYMAIGYRVFGGKVGSMSGNY
jgi:cytochrome bd ubiquinol oxidase subunit II